MDPLSREHRPYYIGADDNDIQEMLETLELSSLDDLFDHIQGDIKLKPSELSTIDSVNYDQLLGTMKSIANKNQIRTSFLGDSLPVAKEMSCVAEVSKIRGLSTAYTPYQPERSQGTLQSLWLYQSLLRDITGFEAINASLYDRASALYEACATAMRVDSKKRRKVLLSEGLFPCDREVVDTLSAHAQIEFETYALDSKHGALDIEKLRIFLSENKDQFCGFAFSQVNSLGVIEDFHQITDLCHELGIRAIAGVDPLHLGPGGLECPGKWGKNGADFLFGEGQHLAIAPNFGGPGLGLFGVRFHEGDRKTIRSTPGRFIGKAKDVFGRECKVIVLSTREQHIRREKATSNICSNQSFLATLAAASLLERGPEGMERYIHHSQTFMSELHSLVEGLQGVSFAYPASSYFLEATLAFEDKSVQEVIDLARKENIHIGVDISSRCPEKRALLKIGFNDTHDQSDWIVLKNFFLKHFQAETHFEKKKPGVDPALLRKKKPTFSAIPSAKVVHYFQQLGEQNLSPDNGIYPLGSCTMKYNPLINDQCAGLLGFTQVHPLAPTQDTQGCLEVLYEIQTAFQAITGLAGVTTQPVAGAQGELVGLKLFQAYHKSKNEVESRKLVLIPRSAHGTNPATAAMTGLEIISIGSSENGEIDLQQIQDICESRGSEIAGAMITNPNTSGIFERNFVKLAKFVHDAGGLVYMDGANMNAIAGHINLKKLGVDAVHNNLHKTWTIPHGGGGPGDAIVAVSEKLLPFLPGVQIVKASNGSYSAVKAEKSIGSFHRHFGNFAHKVRCLTYLKALGGPGIQKMSAVATLCARYLFERLREDYPTLPKGSSENKRMHEFILTLAPELFSKIEKAGIGRADIIGRVGKLFLDFGHHSPTVAFPEAQGLMLEPTESFNRAELERFVDILKAIKKLLHSAPEILLTVPHFTPIDRVQEVDANKNLVLAEELDDVLSNVALDRVPPEQLRSLAISDICELIQKSAIRQRGPHKENTIKKGTGD